MDRCQALKSLLLPLLRASGTRPLAQNYISPSQPLVPWSVRPGEQSRGPEALDPRGPGKCVILPSWVLGSRRGQSQLMGQGHLGSPSSLQQFHIHLYTLQGSVSLSHERAQAPLPSPGAFLKYLFIYCMVPGNMWHREWAEEDGGFSCFRMLPWSPGLPGTQSP